jgi:hypothetical protein
MFMSINLIPALFDEGGIPLVIPCPIVELIV